MSLSAIIKFILVGLLATQQTTATPAYAPRIPDPKVPLRQVKFDHFKQLQSQVLSLIGQAKKSVILITDFLTDGEVSSALYLAKFRKVNVQVYLGAAKINQYLSRLRFLKKQGIQVNLRPNSTYLDPTILLIDGVMYRVSRDLDILRPKVSGYIARASLTHSKVLLASLSGSGKNARIKLAPIPRVGRPRRHQRWQPNYQGNRDGSYNYDRARTGPRPEGIATTLPQVPLFQLNRSKEPDQGDSESLIKRNTSGTQPRDNSKLPPSNDPFKAP